VRAFGLCLLLLVTACAVHKEVQSSPAVTNPYQARAEALARSGVDALGRGKWSAAQMLFGKSLQAATLADDERMISLAWYNLGRARAGGGDASGARSAYQQSMRQAGKAHDRVSFRRAGLALALMDQARTSDSSGQEKVPVEDLLDVPDSFPVDIHLAAARLAWLRGKPELARQAYGRVLVMAGPDRSGLIYAARAHLGLARLSSGETGPDSAAAAHRHLDRAFELVHRAGEPQLMLQALNLAADMEADPARRQQWLQRAEALRRALKEAHAE